MLIQNKNIPRNEKMNRVTSNKASNGKENEGEEENDDTDTRSMGSNRGRIIDQYIYLQYNVFI